MAENEKKRNPWKWAFWTLLAIIVVAIGITWSKISAPVDVPAQQAAYSKVDTSMEVTLNREQVNALSANYLNQFLKDKSIKYRFIVGKKYATLIGQTKFLGTKVQFALNFIPERLSNGNVLLKAKGLSVGQLNVPTSYVMGYIKKSYDLPNWVYLNQRKNTVILDLNKYSRHKSLRYSAEELNMDDGQFSFLISIPNNKGGK